MPNSLVIFSLDRDECLTEGLSQQNTSPEGIVKSNPRLVAYLKSISARHKRSMLRVASSRQDNKSVKVVQEYSGFEKFGGIRGLEAPTEKSLLTHSLGEYYRNDYSKVLIVLGQLFELQALLKSPPYDSIDEVHYYFIDDKKEKLEAIARAFALRPDLAPKKLSTISLVQYVHPKKGQEAHGPLLLQTLKFNNQREIDYFSEITMLLFQFDANLDDPLYAAKEQRLQTRGYRRPAGSVDLALSIETEHEKLQNAPANPLSASSPSSASIKADLANKNLFVRARYERAMDGQTVIYKELFAETRALLRGERDFFANTKAWYRGKGSLFANTEAMLKGIRPLFANTQIFIGSLTEADLKSIEEKANVRPKVLKRK